MAEIYKQFSATDDIVNDIQTVSQAVWSENINPLSASAANAGVGFFTNPTQLSQSGDYYVNVYHRNPSGSTASQAQVQYAIAYGNRFGSGSSALNLTLSGGDINDTPSRAIYSQYRNMLLSPTDTVFSLDTGSYNMDSIVVINVARSRFRQKLDPGNWTLRIGSGSTAANWPTSFLSFTDNSGANTHPQINQAGRIFGIYSGSNGVTASAQQYGLYYPDQGIFIFDTARLNATGATGCGIPFSTGSTITTGYNQLNHVTMSARISGSNWFEARSEEKVTSTHYFVRITNKQFNFSNNPTFVTGSTGTFLYSSMLRNPSVYATTIGLYDDLNRLVAVAKLSKPLLKTFSREALIKVKLDY